MPETKTTFETTDNGLTKAHVVYQIEGESEPREVDTYPSGYVEIDIVMALKRDLFTVYNEPIHSYTYDPDPPHAYRFKFFNEKTCIVHVIR